MSKNIQIHYDEFWSCAVKNFSEIVEYRDFLKMSFPYCRNEIFQ